MKVKYTGIEQRFVIAVKSQMSLVSPVGKLIDYRIIDIILDLHIGTFLRMYVCGTESTGGVTSVDGFDIDHQRLWRFLRVHEIIYVLLLKLASGNKLKLKIAFGRQLGKVLASRPSQLTHEIMNSDRH